MGETPANARRLLWAGFFAIFANGVGFAVRGRILKIWAADYGFTQKELGDITGGGLWGFGLIIIAACLFADLIGYGRLMAVAFLMHVLSAVLMMCTDTIFHTYGQTGVYWSLLASLIMFSIANGLCEVVVNPMVATLFPDQKTHYLNILHAGWPGGLIVGGGVAYFMNDVVKIHWIIQMSMFLVPVAIYGTMLLGQHLPRSEAKEAGVSYTTMLAEFASPILLLLLVIHAMVGYVELGTDSWIQKITGQITSPGIGTLLFMYTNILMFTLRFFGGPLESRLSPLGLLFCCATIATVGLLMLGNAPQGIVIFCVLALTIYGIGKTFYWPTMLAVVSERFPRGGALTLGSVGGMGMLSAGLLGAPAIGFQQDHYATAELKQEATSTFDRYVEPKDKIFLGVFKTKGLDGAKVGLLELETKAAEGGPEALDAARDLEKTLEKLRSSSDPEQRSLAEWWEQEKKYAKDDAKPIDEAALYGSQMALKWTALVPTTMAVLYLFLILYFKARGGYKKLEVAEEL
jgi:MFS family permease